MAFGPGIPEAASATPGLAHRNADCAARELIGLVTGRESCRPHAETTAAELALWAAFSATMPRLHPGYAQIAVDGAAR